MQMRILLSIIFLILSFEANATRFVAIPLNQQVENAELIIIGQVQEVIDEEYRNQFLGSFKQKATIKVEQTIKGLEREEIIILGETRSWSRSTKYIKGDKYLLFLRTVHSGITAAGERERLFWKSYIPQSAIQITDQDIVWYETNSSKQREVKKPIPVIFSELNTLVQQSTSKFQSDIYFQEKLEKVWISDRSVKYTYPRCSLEKNSEEYRVFKNWLNSNTENWYKAGLIRFGHMFIQGFNFDAIIYPHMILLNIHGEEGSYWAHDISQDIYKLFKCQKST